MKNTVVPQSKRGKILYYYKLGWDKRVIAISLNTSLEFVNIVIKESK
jgi:hypothetical protein